MNCIKDQITKDILDSIGKSIEDLFIFLPSDRFMTRAQWVFVTINDREVYDIHHRIKHALIDVQSE